MSKQQTGLFTLFHRKWRRATINGNPRWGFIAIATDGEVFEFKTASDHNSAYGCSLDRLRIGTAMRITYHETAAGNLIADIWDDQISAKADLDGEFERLRLVEHEKQILAAAMTQGGGSGKLHRL